MKKILLLIPCILFPYVLLFLVCCIYTGFLMEEVFDNFILLMLIYLLFYFLLTLLCNVVFIFLSYTSKWNPREILKINMIIKLIQIPAYIVIFVLGLICMLTVFTIGFSIFFVFYDCLSIFLTGMIGAIGIMRLKDNNQKLTGFFLANLFLQFVFCVDVVSSVLVCVFVDRIPCVTYKPAENANVLYEKKKPCAVPLLTIGCGCVALLAVFIVSEICFPEIDAFLSFPLWYRIAMYISLIIVFVGIISSIRLKNRSNTLKIELPVECISFLVGIIIVIVSIFSNGNLTMRILFSFGLTFVCASFFFGISTVIGLCRNNRQKKVQ